MKLAIMQPYFFPYIGYWQLINSVDEFVIYDNIQYTKKGWINRNRILLKNTSSIITLPIEKDSDFLDIRDRRVSNSFFENNQQTVGKIEAAYKKAPFFNAIFPSIERCLNFKEPNLFKFILNSIREVKSILSIATPITVSSDIEIDHTLKGKEKVLSICAVKKANTYINPIGGQILYSKPDFKERNVDLFFLNTASPLVYKQFDNKFVPNLSIIDIMMFNTPEEIAVLLTQYTLT